MNNRNINIDIMKSLALFFVIGVHFFLYIGFYELNYNFFVFFFIIIRNIMLTCVPLFIITTGFLNRNKIWSKKYYLNILYIYSLYSFSIFILTVNDENFDLSYQVFRKVVINTLEYKYYGWYINMYVGLMLIAPIINIAFKYMEEKKQYFAICNIIIAISLPITLFDFFLDARYSLFSNLFPNWWNKSWPLIYYAIGVYFSYKKERIRYALLMLISALLIGGISYYYFNIHFESVVYGNIFCVVTSLCIFNILLNIKVKLGNICLALVKFISTNTLIAYLLSHIVDASIYPYLTKLIPNIHIRLSMFPVVVIFNFLITIFLVFMVVMLVGVLKKLKYFSILRKT